LPSEVSKVKVLAVDDDPVAGLVVEAAVQRLGHDCITAGGGEAAWEMFLELRCI